ncbi:MAG: alpha/beta hydrolase [Gemmatimonadaceae bacterium]
MRAVKWGLIALVSAIAVMYAGAIGYLKFNEADLVFPREIVTGSYPRPADSLRLPYKTVSFRTSDSLLLSAWEVPASQPGGMWVLLCHGQTGHLATTARPEYYAYLRAVGVNILAFDWRGFGASEGTPGEEGLYRDATAAYEYLRKNLRVPAESVVIFGHSLGTAPAIELATRVPAAALVIEGAPRSVRARAQELYPYLPVSLAASSHFNSIGRIGRVRMPILILHARDDKRIPVGHGRALFDSAKSPKRIVELAGQHHDAFRVDSSKYFSEYSRFVSELRARRR